MSPPDALSNRMLELEFDEVQTVRSPVCRMWFLYGHADHWHDHPLVR